MFLCVLSPGNHLHCSIKQTDRLSQCQIGNQDPYIKWRSQHLLENVECVGWCWDEVVGVVACWSLEHKENYYNLTSLLQRLSNVCLALVSQCRYILPVPHWCGVWQTQIDTSIKSKLSGGPTRPPFIFILLTMLKLWLILESGEDREPKRAEESKITTPNNQKMSLPLCYLPPYVLRHWEAFTHLWPWIARTTTEMSRERF